MAVANSATRPLTLLEKKLLGKKKHLETRLPRKGTRECRAISATFRDEG